MEYSAEILKIVERQNIKIFLRNIQDPALSNLRGLKICSADFLSVQV